MEAKSDEQISLFVRDEQTDHFLFNAMALLALGINSMQAQQRGYPLKETPDDAPDTARHVTQSPR